MKTILLLPLFMFASLLRQAQQPATAKQQATTMSYKIIAAASNTFGYDIYSNGKLKIHQPSVPGQPGNTGFKTKAGAESTAKLVIEKIKKGEMPPTVTTDELKALKAI